MAALRAEAPANKAWPFEEARKIMARYPEGFPEGGVLFETGYGPSGLPHIGTFGEVVQAHLDQPLTSVPDPFGTHDSFGAHNNARLKAFLDRFGFDYEFLSSTFCYRSTYSPFLPLCPRTGRVLQVPIVARDVAAGTISYDDPETGERVTLPVTGGHAKLQWKVDWAMRWVALGVDYEMAGKDLIDSVTLSSRITRILGARPPEGFNYELFLDEQGAKISKTKGNGLTIEEWLTYASPESLALYMYQQPRAAKKLHFGVIPRAVDDYFQFAAAWPKQEARERLGNPVFHVHHGPPPPLPPVSFGLLLNLVSVAGQANAHLIGEYLQRYAPSCDPVGDSRLAAMIEHALAFHRDHVAPGLARRAPDAREAAALGELDSWLQAHPDEDADAIQNEIYEIGKRHGFEPLRAWFQALYEILLGATQGPRMGTFIALYGTANARRLIGEALKEAA